MTMDIWFNCPCCSYGTYRADTLRRHMVKIHPDHNVFDFEHYIVTTRNPDLDIDVLIYRYLDRKETIIGLQKQGIFVKKFLQAIGVARSAQADKGLMSIMKRAHMKEQTQIDWALKKKMLWLKDAGMDEEKLTEILTALKIIEYTKRQLQEARNPTPVVVEEPDPPLIGRYKQLFEDIRNGTAPPRPTKR